MTESASTVREKSAETRTQSPQPASKPKSLDRRVLRTKRMLRDALAELIEEKGFERITVCDLTERADINRGTFYTHYRDKNDLLRQSEDDIISDITEIQKGLTKVRLEEFIDCYLYNKPLPFIVTLYDYLRKNGKFVRALMGPKGDPAFMPRLRDIVAKNVKENVLNPKYRENSDKLTDYYISYYATAQLGVIRLWLETGMEESSEEMALIVTSIMFMRPGDAIEMHSAQPLPADLPSKKLPPKNPNMRTTGYCLGGSGARKAPDGTEGQAKSAANPARS